MEKRKSAKKRNFSDLEIKFALEKGIKGFKNIVWKEIAAANSVGIVNRKNFKQSF